MKSINDVMNNRPQESYYNTTKPRDKGNFDDLSGLDKMYYNKCIKKCNHCTGQCTQDTMYQEPVILVGDSGQTILAYKYCKRKEYDRPSELQDL